MKLFKKIASFTLVLSLVLVASLAVSTEAFAKTTTTSTSTPVAIGGVLIQGADVVVATSGVTASEDGLFHLVASDPNQTAPVGTDVAQAAAASGASFTVPLAKDTANSMLFKKFTVCVMKSGALSPVSNSMYITNPEACASRAPARMNVGKKGILPDLAVAVANKNQPAALGAKQVNLNIRVSQLGRLAGYDYSVRKYNSQGMQVNVIILADNTSPSQYVNPYALDQFGAHNYYGLNASTTEGVQALEYAASYLAKHYSGIGYGQVDNFIIGNEVNAWWLWNYMNCGSNDVFMQEYARAFRIMYNGIKSENATANVYTCIDHQWAKAEASYYISGKEFLTKLNTLMTEEGNVDWRVAAHPYNAPLTSPNAWETSKNVSHSQSTPYVTMANLDVLTDFLCQTSMLSPTGAVRTVKVSEVGYTSLLGEQYQAASIVYANLVAENNSHVDGLVISRETDDAGEIGQGLAYGLCNVDGTQKMAYSFFQNPLDASVIAQASAAAGVDLTTLITPR